MKYNLKNLKELVKKTEEQTDFYEIDSSFEAWLVGFEAELREIDLEKWIHENCKGNSAHWCLELFSRKEILGE